MPRIESTIERVREQTKIRVKRCYDKKKLEHQRLLEENRQLRLQCNPEPPLVVNAVDENDPPMDEDPYDPPMDNNYNEDDDEDEDSVIDYWHELPPVVEEKCNDCRGNNNQPVLKNGHHNLQMVLAEMDKLETYKSEGAKKMYMDGVKRAFELTGCEDFENCVSQYKKFTSDLENQLQPNGEKYALNSILIYVKGVRYAFSHIPSLRIDKKIHQQYNRILDIWKEKAKVEREAKKLELASSIPTIPNYLSKINAKFPLHSKQRLVANLQLELGCRDNVSGMIITEKDINDDDTEEKNYIIVPKNETAHISVILNLTKTSQKYPNLRFTLNSEVSNMVRHWINTEKRKYGNRLMEDEKLSAFVSRMHKIIKVNGSINIIRQMVASTDMAKELSIEEKYDRATQSGHSMTMHSNYCRQFIASF